MKALSQDPKHIVLRKQVKSYHFWHLKIFEIIQSLDANKTHRYCGISIRTLKLNKTFTRKPLIIIFQNYLKFKKPCPRPMRE